MLSATAEYIAYEALPRGATPVVRATFLPYLWPNGVNATGTFNECSFVASDRIQADFYGFSGGYWISPVLASNIQNLTSPFVVSWTWNSPGYTIAVFWRTAADTTALAAASWVSVTQGDALNMLAYHQLKITFDGYRAWVEDALADANAFTAYAVDSLASPDPGYVSDQNVSGDQLTYTEALQLLGEFSVLRDIEQAGSVSMEVPVDFSDLVAGDHSGLLLNNRQGSFVGGVWVPAPLFSPNMTSFFLSQQDWYDIQLKIELGWSKGGWFQVGHIEDEWLAESYSDFITLFLGKVKRWGPVSRGVDQPNTVEIYAEDWIIDCLQKRISLPLVDGTPAPLTYGEFFCKAEAIEGWTPTDPVKTTTFEAGDYTGTDTQVESGGGSLSFVAPGLTDTSPNYCLRAAVTGAGQAAYVEQSLSVAGTLFASGTIRFHTVPAAPLNRNITFLKLLTATNTVIFQAGFDSDGILYTTGLSLDTERSDWNVLKYIDVPLTWSIWFRPTGTSGRFRFWINGDEIRAHDWDFSASANLIKIRAGLGITLAESWEVDFDDLNLYDEYLWQAFIVHGAPFAEIKEVYANGLVQPGSKTVYPMSGGDSYTQNLVKYPAWGIVVFESVGGSLGSNAIDKMSDVMVRVVENSGGRHPLAVIETLLGLAGLTSYINAAALAAAYLAVPDDIINARFEGGGDRDRRGLKDAAPMGMTIGDALKEITSRCLYWIFTDGGQIKIIAYTGLMPTTTPVLALTASNKWQNDQIFDLESINDFITATYGWYDHNPSLFYMAGSQTAGGQGTGLDYTWDSPVATENRTMVKAKADLLLKFLSAWERIDQVRTSLLGARIEGMDVVSLVDPLLHAGARKYWVTGKEVGLDQGSRETALQLIRYIGDT